MAIITEFALESNKNIRVNFDGGNLSSDAGLLLMKEFLHKLGVPQLVKEIFQMEDIGHVRIHKAHENLLQMLYQIIGAYYQDSHADALRHDPVITSAIDKPVLASQPTLSRFHNRMDAGSLALLELIQKILRKRVYSAEKPESILFDLDTTLFNTYGAQEESAFNHHYQACGYHPMLCFDGNTADLLKIELRSGAMYCCNGVADFLKPLIEEYQTECPDVPRCVRGDSGFATDELYSLCEETETQYAIRLKKNNVLTKLAEDLSSQLYKLTEKDAVSYAVIYGEFQYQAQSWDHPRRVVCKIEKPYGQIIHTTTFVVTNKDDVPEEIIRFYCKRGTMENYIKECKHGFDFPCVSSATQIVNACRVQIHALAYNLFNWFRRLTLPQSFKKYRIDTLRIKLLKIGCRIVRSSRYVYIKICSSFPYQREFYETLQKIWSLQPSLV